MRIGEVNSAMMRGCNSRGSRAVKENYGSLAFGCVSGINNELN